MSALPFRPAAHEQQTIIGYRFAKDGKTSAILEGTTLSLKDNGGLLEKLPWWEYVTKYMGEEPEKDSIEAQLLQLSESLGEATPIIKSTPRSLVRVPLILPSKAEAAERAAEKRVNAEKARIHDGEDGNGLCLCGCGEPLLKPGRRFRQGHDARFHGWIKKVEDGRMKFEDLNSTVQEWCIKHKIVRR
jgi:hypothetical protein